MATMASNQRLLSVEMQQQPQQLPCPSQALLSDLASCDVRLDYQHFRSHDEVNVYLCLTCGSPVFRDDNEQDSDLISPFCLDCFSMFHSRDSSSNDIDLCDDASMTDMDGDDDDYDHEDHSCCAGSIASERPGLSLSMGFGFLDGGNSMISAA